MSSTQPNGAKKPSLFTGMRLERGDITWAGRNPLQAGFCFGTEDGEVLFTDEDGRPLGSVKGSITEEAINGVAVSGEWMAVSTRASVVMGTLRQGGVKPDNVGVVLGAHDIVATPGGYFVAPLGQAGVMMMKAGSTPEDPVGALTTNKAEMHFYRVLALPGRSGKDLLVCACREGGIGVTEIAWGTDRYNMRVSTFNGLDVVDVCSVASDADKPAVVAIGLDGTVILFRDILHDSTSIVIRFKTVQGTVYRVLSRGDDLYVLTSHALYILSKLAKRLMSGMAPGKFNTQILKVPMEAVDAVLVDQWLLAPNGFLGHLCNK